MNHLRITTLLYPIAGAAILSSCGEGKKEDQAGPLNIVYIMTDDHTRQMMSCYDNRHIETPNLDRIANKGVLFSNAFVANSISGPSRACLVTGKHSHKNGKLDNHTVFDGSQQTVQELLQKSGYETAMIGKWHLDSQPTHFDHWEILPGQGSYYNPDFIVSDGRKKYEGYVTNIITDLGLNWLDKERDKDKPFCLFLHHKAIHRNWMSDTTYLSLYEDKVFEVPSNFFDNYEGRIAVTDQGFYMGEHGWFDKRFMYEESFSTPLLMRLPSKFKRKGEIREMVQNIDFAPTMLAIAGAEIPSDIQGVSLLPLLTDEKSPVEWRKSLYYHYYEYSAEEVQLCHYLSI